jgi:hypothetical protein
MLAFTADARAVPSYQIVPLGLFDSLHTLNNGSHASSALRFSESGYVTGLAQANAGQSAWFYDPSTGTTTRIGLFEGDYTSPSGYNNSRPGLLTENGYLTGRSDTGGLSLFAWVYDASSATTTRLGYQDAAHTASDGTQSSSTGQVTAGGWLGGRSIRYAATGNDAFGETAWLYDIPSGTTTRLGFFDAEHTRSDGYQYSSIGIVTESGYVTGISRRSGGTANLLGESAWLYDVSTSTTTRLGYFDAAHTRSDGVQFSNAAVKESGFVAGESTRYGGMANLGRTAWLRDPTGTSHRLGFFDTGHTRSDSYQMSDMLQLAEAGHSVGFSERFNGAVALGASAWFADSAGATTRIGLFDAEHTSSDGIQVSLPGAYQNPIGGQLTESGYATGSSQRYGGAADLGQSAWVYDASSGVTTRAGFYDAVHTRNDGYQSSFLGGITESGYATGSSQRFDGPTGPGSNSQSAWLYDASTGTTTRLGFYDAAHTLSNGEHVSIATKLTESGYAAGYSRASNFVGRSAWIHDAATGVTTRVGLIDTAHTRSDGNQYSEVSLLTESGWAAGLSLRYAGAADRGTTAWVYHAPTDTIDSILLSTRSDGFASASVSFLSDAGFALGSYTLYGSDDSDLGPRAFVWTPEEGALDLGGLVEGGLSVEGWSYLARALGTNDLGQIIGGGRLVTGGDVAYLLNPVPVPEPGTGLLTMAGLLLLAHRARRCSGRPRGSMAAR